MTTYTVACNDNFYWGMMYITVTLNSLPNNIVVTSNGSRRAVDYYTVEFISSGIRLAYEARETLPTLTTFPNPFQDQITVDLGEPTGST